MTAVAFAPTADAVRAMLDAMGERGADARATGSAPGGAAGVARFAWEAGGALASTVLDGDLLVVADATLYYVDDLRHRLAARSAVASNAAPSALIAAAYRAWGARCAEHLEGDFAFVLWDARARRLVAARDFVGRRPLYWAGAPDRVVVASTMRGVLAAPGVGRGLDLAAIAADAGGLESDAERTAYAEVRRLPAGATLVVENGRAAVAPHWTPPEFRTGPRAGAPSFDDAAAELRELIGAAVAERLDPSGPTAVSLSGGYDSPAVFASAAAIGRDRANGRPPVAVSLSYPPGDPGHEDDLISAAAARWAVSPLWVRSDDVPALAGLQARAAARDEPYPHPFEIGLRALVGRAVGAGARVLLDGIGGDQLFEASDARLADYFRGGRWGLLAREWRGRGGGGRELFRAAVLPSLTPGALAVARLLRGGRPLAPVEAPPSAVPWLRADAVSALGLGERSSDGGRTGGGHAAREAARQLTRPALTRVSAQVGDFALTEGAEERSPLLDGRVVAFAASRPVWERNGGGETKRLLRAAMRGLLPDVLVAPRAQRTGVPVAYLLRAIEAEMPHRLAAELRSPVLAELGLVEPAALTAAWEEYRRTGRTGLAVALYLTLEVELWLRAHLGEADPAVR